MKTRPIEELKNEPVGRKVYLESIRSGNLAPKYVNGDGVGDNPSGGGWCWSAVRGLWKGYLRASDLESINLVEDIKRVTKLVPESGRRIETTPFSPMGAELSLLVNPGPENMDQIIEVLLRVIDAPEDETKRAMQDFMEDALTASNLGRLQSIQGLIKGLYKQLEEAEQAKCEHDWDFTRQFLSYPPKVKCKKCGEFGVIDEIVAKQPERQERVPVRGWGYSATEGHHDREDFIICNDGTAWRMNGDKWDPLPPIPQPPEEGE